MGCDMVVAVGPATVDGRTLFGQNCSRHGASFQPLFRAVGRHYALGEMIRTPELNLSQAGHTYTVLGSQPFGIWGFTHGVNDQGLAVGCTAYQTKLSTAKVGLAGTDLVRLLLERSHRAIQAVEMLADLLKRHGQARSAADTGDESGDHGFLIADASEAYLVETAADHWVYQEIRQVRAASNVCTIHQDWNWISAGLSSAAIEKGWWPCDGSKLDFADALSDRPTGLASALRRWGRATLLLEQQNGHMDLPFLRRLLSDHYEGTHFEVDPMTNQPGPLPLCQHSLDSTHPGTIASMVVELDARPERLRYASCAFGPPCINIFLPIFLEGDLPAGLSRARQESIVGTLPWKLQRMQEQLYADPESLPVMHEKLAHLQATIDQEAADFALEGASLKAHGENETLQQTATSLMQHHLEQFDAALSEIGPRRAVLLDSTRTVGSH